MFHSGNIWLRRWAYLLGPSEPGDGETGKGLRGSQIVGHNIDKITFSYATGPPKKLDLPPVLRWGWWVVPCMASDLHASKPKFFGLFSQ